MSAVPAHDLLAAVAAHGLPGAEAKLAPEALTDEAWTGLLAGVRHQRLAGHLLDAVMAGGLPATPAQRQRAAELHRSAMAHALETERFLLRIVEQLAAASIPYRVLKGLAYAYTVYPNPALRAFGDLDVLVPATRFDDAVAVFAAQGFRRQRPEPRRGFDRRFSKGVTLYQADGLELDLHRTFAQGPFGMTVAHEDLFRAETPFCIGGRTVLGLGSEEAFLHACYHAALGNVPPRLVPLRDIAQHLLVAGIDDGRAFHLMRRWRGEAVVARAVTLTWETFRLTDAVPLSAWAQRYKPSRPERLALASYVGSGRSYGARQLASLKVIPRTRDRVAFLVALAFPRRGFMAEHGYARWWRRGGRLLLHRGQRP